MGTVLAFKIGYEEWSGVEGGWELDDRKIPIMSLSDKGNNAILNDIKTLNADVCGDFIYFEVNIEE